jgi:hypothetical protein
MQRTLNQHLLQLQHTAQELNDRLTNPNLSGIERDRIESEIRIADLALMCYLKAFEIEQKIA